MRVYSGHEVRDAPININFDVKPVLTFKHSMRPDITPNMQPPPGVSWGPAYGPPPVLMKYPGPMQPPPAATQAPPVSSGANPDAGNVYK
jgi:hypothetical protein